MILLIDNYDSFVHNLGRYFELAGQDIIIKRNDEITIDEIHALNPSAIVLSPGPCTPDDAGICLDIVKEFGARKPLLGVCLGHQIIAQGYGGSIPKSSQPMHGRSSIITHNGRGIFNDIPQDFKAGRYHSLGINIDCIKELRVTATSDDEQIMAIQHVSHPVYGVQFHPESILTEQGQCIINNFISETYRFYNKNKDAA